MGNKKPNVFRILLKTLKDNMFAVALIALAVSFVAINWSLFGAFASKPLVSGSLIIRLVNGSDVTIVCEKDVSKKEYGGDAEVDLEPSSKLEYIYSVSNISNNEIPIKFLFNDYEHFNAEYYENEETEAKPFNGLKTRLKAGENFYIRVVISILDPTIGLESIKPHVDFYVLD